MRKSAIAITVAGVLTLAACGSSGPSKSAATKTVQNGRAIVLASVVKTAAADSAKVSLDMSFDGMGNGVSANGEGVLDFSSGDSQFTFDMGGALGSLMSSGFETRTVDGVAYVKPPIGLPSGKEWIAVDTKKFGSTGGGNTALTIGGGSDPTKVLAYLEQVSNGVEQVGTDTVRGVETTHYSAKIDLSKVVQREDVPPALRDHVNEIAGAVGEVPVDVWIDGDGLLRREKLEMSFASYLSGRGAADASGDSPTVTMTMDLFDFGTPVHVEAPPADQVTTLGNGGSAA